MNFFFTEIKTSHFYFRNFFSLEMWYFINVCVSSVVCTARAPHAPHKQDIIYTSAINVWKFPSLWKRHWNLQPMFEKCMRVYIYLYIYIEIWECFLYMGEIFWKGGGGVSVFFGLICLKCFWVYSFIRQIYVYTCPKTDRYKSNAHA